MHRNDPWPPIPAHAVDIDGRPMLPERLVEVDGKPYVRCYLHGLIPADHRCGNSPGDHYCGTAAHPNQAEGEEHDDQASSHDEWDRIQSDKISAIARLHRPGNTDRGSCIQCNRQYPCPTTHIANGWGEILDCEKAEWCRHAEIRLTPSS
jgi:hypothetical protein